MAIAIVTVLGLLIVLGLRRRQTRRWVVGACLGLIGAALLLPMFSNYLLLSLSPNHTSESAQAIVVLGRGQLMQKIRAEVAADLLEAGRAPLIFASGKGDAPRIVKFLNEQGIDPDQLDGEACSRTTLENAKYSAQVLLPRGIRRIILVTDAPHMLRSQLTFRSRGFEVIPHKAPFPPGLSRYRIQALSLKEAISFVTYGLLGRYLPKA
ncbi:MAG: YdcF family protein [Synechococcales bacterium]|nr:YdcF family protein [Synechococcales bacterium]